MGQSTLEQLKSTKAAAIQAAWIDGLARVVSSIVGLLLIGGWIDYGTRLSSPVSRILLSLVMGALALSLIGKYGMWLFNVSWTDHFIARQVEIAFPELRHWLTSALDFQRANCQPGVAVSESMMKHVISETDRRVARLNLRSIVDWNRPRKSLWCVGAMVIVGVIHLGMFPELTLLSCRRLLIPWCDAPWPREHVLSLVNPPSRVPRGASIEFQVKVERGELPDDTQVLFKKVSFKSDRGDDLGAKEGDAVRLNVERSGAVGVASLDHVECNLLYRAIGGDDQQMPWQRIEVVEPPAIKSVSVTIAPPSYSGWPIDTIQGALGGLRVLQGSRIHLHGKGNMPLSQVELVQRTRIESTGEFRLAQRFQAPVDQTEFSIPVLGQDWIAEESGDFALTLIDREGMRGIADPWAIQVIADAPPSISWKDHSDFVGWITPQGVLQLQGSVEDDLGVARVQVRYSLHETDQHVDELTEENPTVLIRDWPAVQSPLSSESPNRPYHRDPWQPHQEAWNFDWSLNSLGLLPGDQISLALEVYDFLPQSHRTEVVHLTVLSELDLIARVSERTTQLLSVVEDRLDKLRLAARQIDEIRQTLEITPTSSKELMDRLQGPLLLQRKAHESFAGEGSVTDKLRQLLVTLNENRVGDVAVRSRVERALESLPRIDEQDLVPSLEAGGQTLDALRLAYERPSQVIPDDVAPALTQVVTHLGRAITSLAELLEGVSAWEGQRRSMLALQDILRQQNELSRATDDLFQQTLGMMEDRLTSEQRRRLVTWSASQLDLAHQATLTIEGMSDEWHRGQQTDPHAVEPLGRGVHLAGELDVVENLHHAGTQIDKNHLGLARQYQRQAAFGLGQVIQSLAGEIRNDQLFADVPDEEEGTPLARWQRLTHLLNSLATGQSQISSRLARLNDPNSATAIATSKQQAESSKLLQLQQVLATKTAGISEELAQSIPLFQTALKEAQSAMQEVSSHLRDLGLDEALTSSVRVERWLSNLAALLADEVHASSPTSPAGDATSAVNSEQLETVKDVGATRLQLRLLQRVMQDIHADTVALHDMQESYLLSPQDPDRDAELRQKQQALSQLQNRWTTQVEQWLQTGPEMKRIESVEGQESPAHEFPSTNPKPDRPEFDQLDEQIELVPF